VWPIHSQMRMESVVACIKKLLSGCRLTTRSLKDIGTLRNQCDGGLLHNLEPFSNVVPLLEVVFRKRALVFAMGGETRLTTF
jgi:hypothetical protein